LIVDDAPFSRRLAERIVDSLGYSAIVADNVYKAIGMIEQGQHFDLLFTDYMMPGTNGRELAREIRLHDPAILVLFTSGAPVSEADRAEFDAGYLAKPFRKADLAAALSEIFR